MVGSLSSGLRGFRVSGARGFGLGLGFRPVGCRGFGLRFNAVNTLP